MAQSEFIPFGNGREQFTKLLPDGRPAAILEGSGLSHTWRSPLPPSTFVDLRPLMSEVRTQVFVDDLRKGYQQLSSDIHSRITAIEQFDSREIGALRFYAWQIGIHPTEAFASPANESEYLKNRIKAHLSPMQHIPSEQSFDLLQKLATLSAGSVQQTVETDTDIRFEKTLAVTMQLLERERSVSTLLPIAQLRDRATAYLSSEEIENLNDEQLRSTIEKLIIRTMRDILVSPNLNKVLQTQLPIKPTFDPENGWLDLPTPPAQYGNDLKTTRERQQHLAETKAQRTRLSIDPNEYLRPLTQDETAMVRKALQPTEDAESANLDSVAILGAANRLGWKSPQAPTRYSAGNGRDYLDYSQVVSLATEYLLPRLNS